MPSWASTRRSSVITEPMAAIESSLQRLKSSKRSTGTFSTWAMTSTGNGTANAATNSTSPSPIQRSMRRCTMASTGSRSPAMVRGVKYGATVPRYRVCCGGSLVSMVGTFGQPRLTIS